MIGILVPEFPSQTHIFFWREIVALREMGESIRIYSTRRPPVEECKHAFRESATNETEYLFPPALGTALVWMLMHPAGTVKAIAYVLSLKGIGFKARASLAGLIPCAAVLSASAKRHGITHLHAHSAANAAHLVALAGLLGGPPYSMMLHGGLNCYGDNHRRKFRDAKFVHTAGKHLVPSVIEEAGVDARRVSPTLMGIDTQKFKDLGKRAFADNRLHMVTVARLGLGKGQHYALRAMKKAVEAGLDVRYTIAGSGPDRALIEAEVKTLGLEDRAKLVGQLSEPEVFDLLQTADLFVLASVGEFEAMPVAVMEAMACGLPALASVIGGVPDMITPGVDGLLAPQHDVQTLAENIAAAAKSGALRKKLSEGARERALRQFDIKVSATKLRDDISSR